ncbi:hypothetical protein [Marinifilum caeruleilacunae]|uniref:V-type ATP synthase subunit E n=1 Tax=Marinifilum caeruleilacunae TaxID=2499076 RepID=A0ABX1X1W2_9BACT|nr:hypothetical protein [Marinifilum caeruleilacunae]NOU62116.1 hypothetical protein [Marinifilum caeruleilacunae]
MTNNKENLEGIVSRLKEKGISAGEEEKQRIIENAKKQADILLSEAETLRKNIIKDAKLRAEQTQKNAEIALTQASRDLVEATKITILQNLKLAFGKQCESLFTKEQYQEKLLKAVLDSISGNKRVEVSSETATAMESFLIKEGFGKQVEIKPFTGSEAKIVVNSSENEGIQFVLSSQDVEEGLFAILNKDLVERITKNQEV